MADTPSVEMLSVPAAFRAFLRDEISDTARELARLQLVDMFGDRIHYQVVPELDGDESECAGGPKPYIWFRQSGTERERCLDENTRILPDIVTLDVEVWAVDPAMTEIGEYLLGVILEGYGDPESGSNFGGIKVHDVLVESQDDDYLPEGFSDQGNFSQSFQVEIYPFSE